MTGLPGRPELLIRGADLVTMDPALGDRRGADLHVRDGEIVAVGSGLEAPAAQVIDAAGMVGLPGLVETHWHLWGTIFRGLVQDPREESWFVLKERHGNDFRPEDTYQSVRLGLAEALFSGVTTVHNYAHNTLSPEDADANLRAHAELGVRARFSYGTPTPATWLGQAEAEEVMRRLGHPLDRLMDFDDLDRLARTWFADEGGLLSLGVAIRGPSRTPAHVYEAEWAEARRRRLPITMHCAGTRGEVARIRQVQILERAGLLGPDVQLVHCNHVDAGERAAMAASGTHLASTPMAELRLGMGFPQLQEMEEVGVLVSLGFDSNAMGGSADMFQVMRLTLDAEHARTLDVSLTSRRILQMATLDGARDLGLDHLVGSLTPGKRADLILVRTDRLHLAPYADPVLLLVHSATAADVDTVLVDGRVLKRGGRLTAVDADAVVREAAAAQRRVLARYRG
jgi:5-methylthioadenosine/S-adenosylhomocysteine deaminase